MDFCQILPLLKPVHQKDKQMAKLESQNYNLVFKAYSQYTFSSALCKDPQTVADLEHDNMLHVS